MPHIHTRLATPQTGSVTRSPTPATSRGKFDHREVTTSKPPALGTTSPQAIKTSSTPVRDRAIVRISPAVVLKFNKPRVADPPLRPGDAYYALVRFQRLSNTHPREIVYWKDGGFALKPMPPRSAFKAREAQAEKEMVCRQIHRHLAAAYGTSAETIEKACKPIFSKSTPVLGTDLGRIMYKARKHEQAGRDHRNAEFLAKATAKPPAPAPKPAPSEAAVKRSEAAVKRSEAAVKQQELEQMNHPGVGFDNHRLALGGTPGIQVGKRMMAERVKMATESRQQALNPLPRPPQATMLPPPPPPDDSPMPNPPPLTDAQASSPLPPLIIYHG